MYYLYYLYYLIVNITPVKCDWYSYSTVAEYVASLHMDADIFHTPSQSKKC